MAQSLVPLADAVLPLIRTRSRELWRYSAANDHGVQMHDGADILALAVDDPGRLPELGIAVPSARDVYQVTHKALASAIRVIARADDSSGIIGDACRALIDLHPRTAAAAAVPPLKLADWIFDFHFDDEVDYFELDPVAYAPALGEKGLVRLRDRVEKLRAEIPTTVESDRSFSYDHREFLVRWFDQRFAVLDRDIEAIIRTHVRDGSVAAWHEAVAVAFEEIGEFDLAIEWAQKATMFGLGYQSWRAAERWLRLLGEHRPQDFPDAVRLVFDRWPTSATGSRLVNVAGQDVVGHILTMLETRPDQLARFHLEVLADPRRAWETATRHEITDNGLWATLAAAYLPIDPIAAITVQLNLVEGSLVEANTRRYGPAARELVAIRKSAKAAAGTDALELVDATIADLRERYRRRPRLMAALDRAKLP